MSTGATVITRPFTLLYADCVGNASNCLYPHEVVVADEEALKQPVRHDYVAASYVGHYRKNANFISSDCVILDVDNEHSDDPKDWAEPLDVALAFPDVCFVVHYSRNHMKEKNGASCPRFHVLFPIDPVKDAGQYCELKRLACEVFPFFDTNALDAGRFFFGTPNPEVEFFNGSKSLTEFLKERNVGKAVDSGTNLCSSIDDCDVDGDDDLDADIIPKGQRNTYMSQYAARILVRLGDTEEAHRQYLREAKKCSPPLSEKELDATWQSARRFYHEKVVNQPGYIPPAQFSQQASAPLPTSNPPPSSPTVAPPSGTAASSPDLHLCPADFTDVGQAQILAHEYGGRLRFTEATGWLNFNGIYWEASDTKAQGVAQTLTARQLQEVDAELVRCQQELEKNGAWKLLELNGAKKAVATFTPDQKMAYERYLHAQDYEKHAKKSRDTRNISAALKEARPMVYINADDLDANPYLLNTPEATYDLRTGAAQEHRAEDYMTKCTTVSPSDDGIDYWEDALDTFFLRDQALIDYIQEVVGLAAIGKVFVETLVIAYGEGRNGKSTFWNTIARILGTYSGNLSAETLMVGKTNAQPEMAELKGSRLVIASELEEGMRLNTARVKQLCSTDKIFAAKKYHQPFSFTPSHTTVLYTNHLPKVGAIDAGTWRRLQVIPFKARIEGNSDVKNYGDWLFENAGGAILKWIIAGAQRVIANNFRLVRPPVVEKAIQKYMRENDWLSIFLEECCLRDPSFREQSGQLYTCYRNFCLKTGEYPRNRQDFCAALESKKFVRHRINKGTIIIGLRLREECKGD